MKKILIIGFVCLLSAGVSATPLFNWGSAGLLDSTGDVRDRDNSLVSLNSDWLVELVDILSGDVLFSYTNMFQFGAGEMYYFDPNIGQSGSDVVDAAAWNGITVKTVIYDHNLKGSASYMAEFDTQFAISWSGLPPATIGNNVANDGYDAGGVAQGDWVAVPEPTVAALIGIFGGGLLVGRRFFNKEA